MINKAIEDICKFMWRFNHKYKERFYSIDENQIKQIVDIVDKGTEGYKEAIDFRRSKIEIANSKYIGSCKFFRTIQDWEKAQKYDLDLVNQIAFVVISVRENSSQIDRYNSSLPIVFAEVPEILLEKHIALTLSKTSLCVNYFATLPEIKRLSIFQRIAAERLEDKSENVMKGFSLTNNNWLGTLVFSVFDTIEISSGRRGYYNSIAKKIDFYNIINTLNTIKDVEALIFGAAGLLKESYSPDQYMYELRGKFDFLKKKHAITPLKPPAVGAALKGVFFNLAYLAALLFENKSLFYDLINCRDLTELRKLLTATVSDYWQTHLCFGTKEDSSQKRESISGSKIDLMIVNGMIPYLFTYAKINKLQDLFVGFLFDLYDKIPAEENTLVSGWHKSGHLCKRALEAQAVIQLSKKYCKENRCSYCEIGQQILSR